MSLFSRKPKTPADPRPGIAEFWAWWADDREEVLAAAAAQDVDAVAVALTRAVCALHPELDWELGAGKTARYMLIVSGGGKPELRTLAERWWRAAPPPDETVEYSPVRPRVNLADANLRLEDFDLPLVEFVAGTRMNRHRGRFDVMVHHPLFPLLSDAARAQACFLALDAALGEDDVERWVGSVEVAVDSPVDAIPLSGLVSLADRLRPDTAHAWATFQAQGPHGPIAGLVRHPFARVDRPLADTHVLVTLGYRSGEQGMPAQADFTEQVGRWEEQALQLLGGDGPHAVLVGHETGAGRCRVHFYVDTLEIDPAILRSALRGWRLGSATLDVSRDPAWREIGHLLT